MSSRCDPLFDALVVPATMYCSDLSYRFAVEALDGVHSCAGCAQAMLSFG